jgi:hypothetical protein
MVEKKKWLAQNPQLNLVDIAFLLEKEVGFMKTCIEADAKKAACHKAMNSTSSVAAHWTKQKLG